VAIQGASAIFVGADAGTVGDATVAKRRTFHGTTLCWRQANSAPPFTIRRRRPHARQLEGYLGHYKTFRTRSCLDPLRPVQCCAIIDAWGPVTLFHSKSE
jgi:hypothetical protein